MTEDGLDESTSAKKQGNGRPSESLLFHDGLNQITSSGGASVRSAEPLDAFKNWCGKQPHPAGIGFA